MVTDYETATKEIAQYTLRGNRFMGVDLVSNDPGVFVTNAGPITTGQPVRRLQREYIDQVILNARVRSSSTETLRTYCSEIIDEWLLDESMATALSIRSVVTRVYIRILTEKILPETFTREITFNYLRRFAEFSLFGRYAPTLIWLLGTREGIRKDVFIRLRRYNIDNVAIDMTMFAAMFSVGTNIMRCIELCRSHRLNYPSLSATEKVQFVIESQRLHPTVTTVHRIVEENEEFLVAGVRITADPGDEIDYPFVCINRDVTVFADPENFNPLRTFAELQKVLSWSTGSHVCPARDISIMSVVLLLDALSTQHDLSKLCVFNPEF
jgi:hypothetical protein